MSSHLLVPVSGDDPVDEKVLQFPYRLEFDPHALAEPLQGLLVFVRQ